MTRNPKDLAARKMVLIGVAIFVCIGFLVAAAGDFDRSKTQPLMQLTLTPAGCEFVRQNGISATDSSVGCTAAVRFHNDSSANVINIERNGLSPINLGAGQIISRAQMNEEGSVPWSSEHKWAIGKMIVLVLVMLGLVSMAAKVLSGVDAKREN